jgi:hypothetical protein
LKNALYDEADVYVTPFRFSYPHAHESNGHQFFVQTLALYLTNPQTSNIALAFHSELKNALYDEADEQAAAQRKARGGDDDDDDSDDDEDSYDDEDDEENGVGYQWVDGLKQRLRVPRRRRALMVGNAGSITF